ncbi:MAG: spore cortex biosynthesis protein YabQ [Suilimivivens sp.]
MSPNIINEVTFLLHSFLMGIVISLTYDGFLVLRKLIRHNLLMISLEDMIFWIACAIGVFYMLYEENNGVLRWFAVFGATLGMIVYKKTVSTMVVYIVSLVIGRTFQILSGIICFLFKPARFIWKKVHCILCISSKKGKKAGKHIKNKLTCKFKLLKITLCKR